MIDLLEIKIPFDASLVEVINDRHSLVGLDYQLILHSQLFIIH